MLLKKGAFRFHLHPSRKAMKRNFIDHHCHLLPGLDDGATDPRESVEMARLLADFGFATVHCTPHRITGCYENDPARVTQATRSLQRLLDDEGVALRLIPGTEHYLDEFLIDLLPGALTAAPSRRLLVEVPFRSGSEMVPSMVAGLLKRGLSPLFAHPERCNAFEPALQEEGLRGALSFVLGRQKKLDMEGSLVLTLRGSGCGFQGNLGSFAGLYGSEVKQRAILFLEHGVYCCLGSDAHRSQHLSSMLSAGLEAVVSVVGEEAAFRLLDGSSLES
jgi:protein-tyrosine phosphatase